MVEMLGICVCVCAAVSGQLMRVGRHKERDSWATHAEVDGVDRAETFADFGLPRFADVFEQESYPIGRGQVVRGAAGHVFLVSAGCVRLQEKSGLL
jgi:hypothetical protein